MKILEPAEASPQTKVKLAPKPPRAVSRISAIEKKIELGLQLLYRKSNAAGNMELSRLRRKLGVESVSAQEACGSLASTANGLRFMAVSRGWPSSSCHHPLGHRTPGPNSSRRSSPSLHPHSNPSAPPAQEAGTADGGVGGMCACRASRSRFGKIATKLCHPLYLRCYPSAILRCSTPAIGGNLVPERISGGII
jgi:hypothetical protein